MAGKIKSWDELKKLRDQAKKDAVGSEDSWVVSVGVATCGAAAGGDKVMEIIRKGIESQHLENVTLLPTGCFGNCYAEPVVEVRKGNMPAGTGVRYGFVDEQRAKDIVEKHLKRGELLDGGAIVGQEVQTP